MIAATSWPGLGSRALAFAHFCRASNDTTLNPLRFVEALSTALARRYPPFAAALLNLQQREPCITITQTVGEVTAGGAVHGVDKVIIGDLAALTGDQDEQVDLALRNILETSIDQIEPAFSGHLAAVTLAQRDAMKKGGIVANTELLQELRSIILPSVVNRGPSWLDAPMGLPRNDPWAHEIRLRVAAAIALHSQNRRADAVNLLHEALQLPYQEMYGGYRAPACLSVACTFMALGNAAGAAMAIAQAHESAQAMLDDAPGAERLALVDAVQEWLDTAGDHPMVDIDDELRHAAALSAMTRGLRLEYLAARYASVQDVLRRLALAAIDDLTVADTILAWLAGLCAQQGTLRGTLLDDLESCMLTTHSAM